MIPTVKDILNLLDEIAPFNLAEEWDNSGLQIGSPDHPVGKMLMALDPTMEAVREARSQGAQLLLTHHPLIFRTLSSIDLDVSLGRVILEAIKGNLAVVSAHTNLDRAENGINQMLARLFELQDIQGLELDDRPLSGLGRIGNLPASGTLDAIAAWVKTKIGASHVLAVGEGQRVIHRVAVVGGSGGGMVSQAFRRGADLLITGDIGHHASLEALSLGICLLDCGHFLTEWSALRIFKDYLQGEMNDRGWEIRLEFFDKEGCPYRPV